MFAFFGVGNLGRQRGEPGGGQLLAHGVAGQAQGARVDDEDALDALPQQAGQVRQQPAADDDVVVVPRSVAGDFNDG